MTCLSNWAKKEHDVQAENIFRLSFTCASVANVSNKSEYEVKLDLNAVQLLKRDLSGGERASSEGTLKEIFLGESARHQREHCCHPLVATDPLSPHGTRLMIIPTKRTIHQISSTTQDVRAESSMHRATPSTIKKRRIVKVDRRWFGGSFAGDLKKSCINPFALVFIVPKEIAAAKAKAEAEVRAKAEAEAKAQAKVKAAKAKADVQFWEMVHENQNKEMLRLAALRGESIADFDHEECSIVVPHVGEDEMNNRMSVALALAVNDTISDSDNEDCTGEDDDAATDRPTKKCRTDSTTEPSAPAPPTFFCFAPPSFVSP